jgi:uncharacterized protein (TIGR00251 family)
MRALPAELRITPAPDGLLVGLLVSAGSARRRLVGLHDDRLKVAVREPPERGRANRAVARLLEGELGLPRGSVEIVAGGGSRTKTALVRGVGTADLREKVRRALVEDAER